MLSSTITNTGLFYSGLQSTQSKLSIRNTGHGKRQCIKCQAFPEKKNFSLDRREFVLGSSLGSLLGSAQQASAAPVELNDFSSCAPSQVDGVGATNCCPPDSSNIVDFVYDTRLPLRTRQAAHLVSSDYIAKYQRAYDLMRALPDSDPRSFTNQANVHCAYCNDAYKVANNTLQIHDSWFFFPWHRLYLYFHERIICKLLNDDTFALPYWNWDNQSATGPLGNIMPPLYLSSSSSLYDVNRDPDHFPNILVDLNYDGTDPATPPSDSDQRAENNAVMYQQIVSGARTTSLFLGQPYRAGETNPGGPGSMESTPHGNVHGWTGNDANPNGEDMGTFYSAARDPIFYAHHSNIDRIWSVWKTIPGGRRQDYTDPDWLDASFLFYDENARLVRVRVRDAVDTKQLGYTYVDNGNEWINARPTVLASRRRSLVSLNDAPAAASADVFDDIEEFGEAVEGKIKKLKERFRSKVKRPFKNKLEKLKRKILGRDDDLEEVLVIQGVELDCGKFTKFDVYINCPDADESTNFNVVEYVGSYVNVPHFPKEGQSMKRVVDVRLGIGDTLQQLGVKDEDDIVVTLVPKGLGKQNPVEFKGFKIEYE